MTALLAFVEIDQLVITALAPASWRTVDFAGKTVTAAGIEMSTALKLLALFSQ